MQEASPYEILPIIIKYLRSIGLKKIAGKIQKKISKENQINGEFQQTELNKIIKFYIQHQFNNSKEDKFMVNQVTSKKIKKTKEKKPVEEEDVEEEVEEEEKEEKKVEEKKKIPYNQQKQEEPVLNPFEKKDNFSRVDYSRMHQLKTELKDNTFEAKQKYGHGDQFGELGHSRLSVVQGRNFKKEKTKLKNKQFQGAGTINTAVINSIKL